MERAGVLAELTAQENGYAMYPKKGELMILSVVVGLKEIYKKCSEQIKCPHL